MRLFETLLLLTLFLYFLRPVLSRGRWKGGSALPVLAIIFLGLHLALEGYRWQMFPAYGLSAVLFLYAIWQRGRKQGARNGRKTAAFIFGLLGLILVALIAVPPIALPIPQMAEPGGPYKIGTITYYWVDESRVEQFGPEPGGPRELMVQLWYPAQPVEGAEFAPWDADIEVAGPALAKWLEMPSFLLNHLVYARTHSVPDAPLSDDQSQYPVVIFSHGLGGIRVQSTYLMEALASEGYVVASIDHTYGGAVTVFPDGRVALFDPATIDVDSATPGNKLIHIWTEDGQFVLDQLDQLNAGAIDGRFTDRLQLDQIGYAGHSTGGGTAYLFCLVDKRCGAGVALDGWLEPIAEEVAAQPIERPFLFLKAEDWSTPENSAAIETADESRDTQGSVITIPGTRHFNFSDLPLLSPLTPQLGLTGPANGPETLNLISEYTINFFNDQLGR